MTGGGMGHRVQGPRSGTLSTWESRRKVDERWLAFRIVSTELPYCRAIAPSVSPPRTR